MPERGARLPPGLATARLSGHAHAEMARRGLSEERLRAVLSAPEQWFPVRAGRIVCQSRVAMEERTYLIRVFVDVDRAPPEVVTVYRTSKIEKYWRAE